MGPLGSSREEGSKDRVWGDPTFVVPRDGRTHKGNRKGASEVKGGLIEHNAPKTLKKAFKK
jgi:hypothetical protein